MTQIYKVFLDTPSEPFLFSFKQEPQLRPKVGDSITQPATFQNFRIMRDEFTAGGIVRITDNSLTRVTDSGATRILDGDGGITNAEDVTHNYFVQPANNPNRISTWTTNTFADDQTLRQLFR